MLDKIKALQEEIKTSIASSLEEVDELRIKYISKKGSINKLLPILKMFQLNRKKKLEKPSTI